MWFGWGIGLCAAFLIDALIGPVSFPMAFLIGVVCTGIGMLLGMTADRAR